MYQVKIDGNGYWEPLSRDKVIYVMAVAGGHPLPWVERQMTTLDRAARTRGDATWRTGNATLLVRPS